MASCGINGGSGAASEPPEIENMKHIRHKIAVMSGKGGVGKSTVATNLALILAKRGYKVGLLDCDLHGPTVPTMLGLSGARLKAVGETNVEPVIVPPNLKVVSIGFLLSNDTSPVVWRGPLKMAGIRQLLEEVLWGELDYLIIDLPPGTGDESLTIAQLIPDADGTVIVTTPQEVALVSVRKCINFAKGLNFPVIGIIENMSGFVCQYCGKTTDLFKTGGGLKASEDFNVPFLGKVPLDPQVVEAGDSGKPFVTSYPESEPAKEFEKITDAIEKQLKKKKK
jgi:Mrp family chromosome partitioning ATPase